MVGAFLVLATLGFGGCAQQPQQIAASHGKEYFPSTKYGAASRRVVADGQPIPRGGGQYLVGKPYTVAGQTYYPSERKIVQVGNASWYGDAFHGRLTANGEIYDKNAFTAAHPTMPLPSYARVTNLRNNSSMIVRVNDRGPYASNRIMDVSGRVAEALDFKRYGTAKLKVEYVGRASLAGSDDARLFATLRTNGPAQWEGEPTMVASAAPRARVASLAPYAPEARRTSEAPVDSVAADEERQPGRRHLQQAPRDADAQDQARRDERDDQTSSIHVVGRDRDRRDAARAPIVAERDRQSHEPPVRVREASTKKIVAKASVGSTTVARMASGKAARPALMPPSRPMDLGTIPGADSLIGAHHKSAQTNPHSIPLRLARSRDD